MSRKKVLDILITFVWLKQEPVGIPARFDSEFFCAAFGYSIAWFCCFHMNQKMVPSLFYDSIIRSLNRIKGEMIL